MGWKVGLLFFMEFFEKIHLAGLDSFVLAAFSVIVFSCGASS